MCFSPLMPGHEPARLNPKAEELGRAEEGSINITWWIGGGHGSINGDNL